LQVCEVGAGAAHGALVKAAEAMPGQDRPRANGHAVATARTGEDQDVEVGAGRELAADRLDHQGSQGDLTEAGVAFGGAV